MPDNGRCAGRGIALPYDMAGCEQRGESLMDNGYEKVRQVIEGSVATVELARPDSHNALDADLISELTRCFEELSEDDSVRVVVLTGEGRSFCAGADIAYMRDTSRFSYEENVADARALAAMFESVDRCGKPVVGRVQGAAIGGGVGLVAACDIVVAAERARLSLSEVRLGIAPATIAPFVVPKVGFSQARALFLTSERITASRAREIGLVHEVVAEEDLDAAVGEKVVALLEGGPGAQAACKEIVREVAALEREEATERMAQRIAGLRTGDEGQEGLSAFLEKRAPRWSEG